MGKVTYRNLVFPEVEEYQSPMGKVTKTVKEKEQTLMCINPLWVRSQQQLVARLLYHTSYSVSRYTAGAGTAKNLVNDFFKNGLDIGLFFLFVVFVEIS